MNAPLSVTDPPSVMVPVLVLLPIVRLLPAVAELIAVFSVTAKLVVLPTMVSDPLLRAVLITDTSTLEFAETVSVPLLSDQPEPELEDVEMVRVWPARFVVTNRAATIITIGRLTDEKRLIIKHVHLSTYINGSLRSLTDSQWIPVLWTVFNAGPA